MPRAAKPAVAEAMATTNPRLVVVNSSTSQGRYQQMFRIRPTLLARARGLTVGPMYLILEHALEKLCAELEALPPGNLKTLNAFEMDPSAADIEMLDNVPRRRTERTARTKKLEGSSDDAAAPLRASKKSR